MGKPRDSYLCSFLWSPATDSRLGVEAPRGLRAWSTPGWIAPVWAGSLFLPFVPLIAFFHLFYNFKWWKSGLGTKGKQHLESPPVWCVAGLRVGGPRGQLTCPRGPWKENSVSCSSWACLHKCDCALLVYCTLMTAVTSLALAAGSGVTALKALGGRHSGGGPTEISCDPTLLVKNNLCPF